MPVDVCRDLIDHDHSIDLSSVDTGLGRSDTNNLDIFDELAEGTALGKQMKACYPSLTALRGSIEMKIILLELMEQVVIELTIPSISAQVSFLSVLS